MTPSKARQIEDKPRRYLRPKDAATLVIVDFENAKPRILMGQRHAGHVFMPGKFVFPGGGVDAGDARAHIATPLRPEVETQLVQDITPARARALALSALRETFEETGLALGAPHNGSPRSRTQTWRAYHEAGALPALDKLDYVARAITPPGKIRRFDTRFFMTNAASIQSDPSDVSKGSGELLKLHWLTTTEAQKLDLPTVTRMVIGLLERHFVARAENLPPPAIPFFRVRHGKRVKSEL